MLGNPLYDIRVFTGPQRQQVTENLGFKVVPILENHVDAFEKVSNNSKKLSIFDAYRQLSSSLDLINIVSDQLIEEWSKSRPDIVIADFITLSGGLIAEQLQIPWITTMATQFAIETTDGRSSYLFWWNRNSKKFNSSYSAIARKENNSLR